jgi:hypothetical protein
VIENYRKYRCKENGKSKIGKSISRWGETCVKRALPLDRPVVMVMEKLVISLGFVQLKGGGGGSVRMLVVFLFGLLNG